MDANVYRVNKVLGLVLGTALVLQAVHIIDGNFRGAESKHGSEIAAKENSRRPARLQGRRSTRYWRAPQRNAVPRSPNNAKPATTSKRARARRSAPISMVWSAARSLPPRASIIPRL